MHSFQQCLHGYPIDFVDTKNGLQAYTSTDRLDVTKPANNNTELSYKQDLSNERSSSRHLAGVVASRTPRHTVRTKIHSGPQFDAVDPLYMVPEMVLTLRSHT